MPAPRATLARPDVAALAAFNALKRSILALPPSRGFGR